MDQRLLHIFANASRNVLIAGCLLFNPAVADVYIFQDAEGVSHYTNAPIHDRYQRLVTVMEVSGKGNRSGAKPLPANAATYGPFIDAAAEDAGIDKALVHAVVNAESGYNPKAVSKAGAMGLMQLMPGTAKRYAVENVFDPVQNLRGGTSYLRDLLVLFDNDIQLAVAAYNAGEHTVIRHGKKIPPYRETLAYVPKVLALYRKYAALN